MTASLPWHARLLRLYGRMPDHPMKLRLYDWLRSSRAFRHVTAHFAYGTFKLDLIDYVQHAMFQEGSYEPASFALFRSLVEAGSTVVDIGANVGQYSLAAARLAGPGGRIVAVEPHPGLCARLLDNIRLSKAEDRILPVSSPLASSSGFVEFGLPEAGALGTTRPRRQGEKSGFLAVAVTMGDLAHRLGLSDIAVMKVDIEGYDLAVIDDMLRRSALRPRHILFEYLPSDFHYALADADLPAYFSGFGYDLLTVERRPYAPGQSLPEHNLWARRIAGWEGRP